MAGFVSAESLVRGEGLAAEVALETNLSRRCEGGGCPSAAVAAAGEHYEAEGEDLVLRRKNIETHILILYVDIARREII